MATAKSVKPAVPPLSEQIKIAALRRTHMKMFLMGDTPLIVHAWSHKAKLMMLAKHMGKPLDRFIKNPYEDFVQSMYRFDDGNYGFPVVALKEAMATVTADLPGITRTQIYRNISVTGRRGFQIGVFADLQSPHELGEIFSPNAPQMREDMVRLSGPARDPDIRYRAEYWPWAMELTVAYDDKVFDQENLYNLIARAGFSVGLGEWRQEKGGSNGLFHPAEEHDTAEIGKWKKKGPIEPRLIDSREWLQRTVENLPTKEAVRVAKANAKATKAAEQAAKAKRRTNGQAQAN
jgi:hypothetical protein